MQSDGHLVVSRGGRVLWSNGQAPVACGSGGCGMRFQADGHLVVFANRGKSTIWSSDTTSYAGSKLVVSAAAPYISIVNGSSIVWAGVNLFAPGLTLPVGSFIAVGGMRLTMQDDGHLVLSQGGVNLWRSYSDAETCDTECGARFQADGHLIVYKANGQKVLWDSGAVTKANPHLMLSSTAPFVIVTGIPQVGVTVHTLFVTDADGAPSWHWTSTYQGSSTYWATNKMTPTLGFYDQTQGVHVPLSHYRQLQQAHVDYALVSWFGNVGQSTDTAIDGVLEKYWKIFSEENETVAYPIKMAVIMEYAETNYQSRIDYLRNMIYNKYPNDWMTYAAQPLLVLSFGTEDAAVVKPVVSYAQSKGFAVVNGQADASTGNPSFAGVTMTANDPHRITAFAAGVSPSIDTTGIDTPGLIVAEKLPFTAFEAENLPIGCGHVIQDGAASGTAAVESTGQNCTVVTTNPSQTAVTRKIPTTANYLTEWYAVFRIKAPILANLAGVLSVASACGTAQQAFAGVSFPQADTYVHIPVHFSLACQHAGASTAPVTLSVGITSGQVVVDRLWVTTSEFRSPSIEEYDTQWVPIYAQPLSYRPQFITVASLNSWGEGTSIEDNTYLGVDLLERTASWADKVKAP